LYDVFAAGGQTLFRALGVGTPLSRRHRNHGRRPGGHFPEPVPGAVSRRRGRHGRRRANVGHVHAVGPACQEHFPATVASADVTDHARREAVRGLAAAPLRWATAFGRLQRFGCRRLQRVHYRLQIGVRAHDPGRLGRSRRRGLQRRVRR